MRMVTMILYTTIGWQIACDCDDKEGKVEGKGKWCGVWQYIQFMGKTDC
jgi:hypothetical protein